ncbi:MAG: LysR family transcriptional regulator, partial [Burkholderiales bacterium]|nr:LysR family transcriptional regulator [Burkholderiales bacterium]
VTILALVAAGTGLSILPDTYRNASVPGIVYQPITGAASQSRLLLAWRAGERSPLLDRFLAMAHDWPGFATTVRRTAARAGKPVAA